MRDAAGPRQPERNGDGCPDALRDALRRPVDLGAGARARLDAALAAEPRVHAAPAPAHASRWFVRPLRVPPLAMGAAAAALLLAGMGLGASLSRARTGARPPATVPATTATTTPERAADTVRVVRFVLVAPRAARVSLVGDFNAWDATRTPMRAIGDGGVWTVELPVSEGRHLYAFVVDGSRWVVDPAAPIAPEDDFGTRNSVLVVGAET